MKIRQIRFDGYISAANRVRRLATAFAAIFLILIWGISCFRSINITWQDRYHSGQLDIAGGRVFCLETCGSEFWTFRHSIHFYNDTSGSWNNSAGFGPVSSQFRYPASDGALVDYASGRWQNMLTSDAPTNTSYGAVVFPIWIIMLLACILVAPRVARRIRRAIRARKSRSPRRGFGIIMSSEESETP
jgi:hypothetical protein